jgi:natural product biosynthesis luciferase-like monooxygenase protein/amino acid adenylation domain-containing protein
VKDTIMPSSLCRGPRLELTDDDPRDAVAALLRAATQFPDAGVRTPDGLQTYPQLLAQSRRILTGLRGLGLRAGDFAVLQGLPLADFFATFWACVLGGIKPVAIAAPADDGPVLERLRHTWLLLERPLVLTDAAGVAALETLSGPPAVDVGQFADVAQATDLHRPDEEDVALLMLSSGSTGPPKTTQLTHRGLVEFCAGTRRILRMRPDHVTLNWLPVDHSGAFLFYHVLEVFVGCTNVQLPTELVIADPLRWLDELAAHQVNHSWAPTFGLQLVADAVSRQPNRTWDLTGIRSLVCGGEQVTVPVVNRFFDATAPFGLSRDCLWPVWGMAETTTAITLGGLEVVHVRKSSLNGDLEWTAPDAPGSTAFVAVGSPAHGAAIRVVDQTGQVLPEGRIGHLQVSSRRVTVGYVNDPEATRAALPDGQWLRTGDLAFVKDGRLVITGREKDVIVVNGHNLLCHEIEEVAGSVAGVLTGGVGACGIPNPDTGTDDLVVFFEAGDGDPVRVEREIKAALFSRLRLTAARIVAVPTGQFPRTGSGKVQRAALRERLQVQPDVPTRPTVLAVVREVLGQDIDLTKPFYESGANSVRLVQLRARLEEVLGRTIPATALFEHPTAAALTDYLMSSGKPEGTRPRESASDNRVAIIGMAARFPGASSVDQFWANLRDGVDSVAIFDRAGDPDVIPVGGVLDDVDTFDGAFFGISMQEAGVTDAAHRMFLECAYQALEHGGYAGSQADARIGVYAGSGMNLYGHQDRLAPVADVPTAIQATIGSEPDFLATRVAYRLGLTGPAIGVQTACSTSLVAVHLAVQALLNGDADLALAGAAALRLPQDSGYRHFPGSILSPTGRCRAFDAEADGTVGGNGVAAVLLKRLDQAIADGDTIHAVILGTAVNNDGRSKVGFTAPSVPGQVEVVREALRRAGVAGETISYVEAHGTGTPLGDPVEFEALSRALGADTDRRGFCTLGSVKPNIGHLDSCAGMAGLIKTVLMLRHRELVPTLNLKNPNPEMRLADSPFVLGTEHRPWTTDGTPRRAGVSALGVGGTNAHVVLQEAPAANVHHDGGRAVVAPLSAHTPQALAQMVRELREHLRDHPAVPAADVAATLAMGRPHLTHRLAVVGGDAGELAQALERAPEPGDGGPLVFAFSGQGKKHENLARWLHAEFPVARPMLDAYDGELAQPALFACQAALVEVWRSLGVQPDAVAGHSLGEYAALYAAGSLSFEDGLRLTELRGELMQSATEPGGMVAVIAALADAQRIARDSGVEVAAVNGAETQVLSGSDRAIALVTALLDREGLVWRRLDVDRAFHSALIDPILEQFREHAGTVALRPPRIPMISGLDGTRLSHVDADYLCRQTRQPVRFDLALANLADSGAFIEIGPDDVLSGIGRKALPGSRWSPSHGTGHAFPLALAEAYRAGAAVDWATITRGHRIPLPGYPFQRRKVEPQVMGAPPAKHVLDTVRGLVARQLGADVESVQADRSFLEMGADSLSLMNMVRELTDVFGVRVPVRDLFTNVDTPRKLAALLGPASKLPEPADPPREQVVVQAAPDAATLRDVIDRQLKLADQMVQQVTGLMSRQLALLEQHDVSPRPAAQPMPAPMSLPAPMPTPLRDSEPEPAAVAPVSDAAAPVTVTPATAVTLAAVSTTAVSTTAQGCDFSLYFFGDYPDSADRDKYGLIMAAAEYADEHGFHTLWLPERHFHSFGALFPNPSVLAGALAGRTKNIRLHAGSVVLPLHDPIRVAEEWSVVDNLSGGRAGLCVASGWHARDFVLSPDAYGNHREEMYTRLDTVRKLWSGAPIEATAGNGEQVEVRLYPRPLQAEPPMFVAVLGNPDSYRRAAREGLGVVTNLMSQTIEELGENIALYRRARAESGLDPDAGRVVVLVHTYLGDEVDAVRAEAFAPFCDYLRSSLSLFGQVTNSLGIQIDLDNAPQDDVDFLLEQAYQRYCDSRALIGTPDSCGKVIDGLLAAGVNEIACFVDFGVPADRVLAGLPSVDELRRRHAAVAQPISHAQRRIWFLERLHPHQGGYHEPKAIRLDGPLDVDALRGSLRRVVARHPSLRTVFREINDELHGVVLTDVNIDCPVVDFSGSTEKQALDEAMRTDGRQVFDLATGPLLLARLLRFSDEHHVLFLLAHHIVFDSQSTVVFARDLAAYYRTWPSQPALRSIREIPAAQPDSAEDMAFWRRLLAGAPELRLPTDHPRPLVRSGEGAHLIHELDGELAESVRRFGREQQATVFTTLLGAFGVVLAKFTGQDDLVVGTGVAGRPPEAEDAIGMFVETIPLRMDLSGDPSFADLARRFLSSTMECYEHRGVPFDRLVSALNPDRDPSRNPLFQVAVEYENAGTVEFDPPHLTATLMDLPSDRAPLDLLLYLTHHADGIRCAVEYDTALFEESTVRRILAYFEHVLRTALPATRLSEIDLIEEDRQLLAGWQGTPASSHAACLHELVERHVDLSPTAIALAGPLGELSYRELDERANQVAHQLITRGVSRGDLVGVHLPRGQELIVAILGVLKSGAGFLPLDPSLPAERLRFMTRDSGTVLLLTDRSLPAFGELPTQFTEDIDTSTERPRPQAEPDDLAYCIYTSGSTGTPKGVLVPHRGTANLVLQYAGQHTPTRTLQWASPAFDGSVYEIFTALGTGAALVLIDDKTRYDPAVVAEVIRRYEVERVIMPFTPLRYLLELQPSLPSLREILSAGEATVPTAAVHNFMTAHPQCGLYNGYGPTETSICVTMHRVLPGESAPPIGRPIGGAQIRLLDARMRPVPVGAIGEIYIGGVCVTNGYVGRPVETAAAFVGPGLYRTGDLGRWRADGALEFHGRTDDQVKIRGNRIEPGEVRHALTQLAGVRDAAVLVHDEELVAYIVADEDPSSLTGQLAARLPSYLVPRRWVRMDRLPVTTNGKLDRSRLPQPARSVANAVSPTTPTQKALHALWCDELDLSDIDIDKSFFELGGHSLTVTRLLNRVRTQLGADYSMTEFFLDPTIRAMAAKLEPVDAAPLTHAQRRLWSRHHDRANPSVYNGVFRVDIEGQLDPAALRGAVEQLVSRHAALRTRFFASHQEVLAPFPVPIAVDDLLDDETEIVRWCLDQGRPAFELSSAPLLRVRLGRITPHRWVLAVVVHHMIFDGWSAQVFWQELSALYNSAELPPPSSQYPGYARWEEATLRDRGRLESFWRTELAGATLYPDLPYDRRPPAALSGTGARVHTSMPVDPIRSVAESTGKTPYAIIAAGFARWMFDVCGQDDVVLATSSSRRTRPEDETMIGYVGEAVLVRVRPGDDIGARLYAALDHQALPLSEVVRVAIPAEADRPYPAVLFTVVTTPPPSLTLGETTALIRGYGIPGLARTELYVVFTLAENRIALDIEYSTDLFDESSVSKFASDITRTIGTIAEEIGRDDGNSCRDKD